ncbi:MAG: hypothetical protein ACYTGB_12330, partial [Planctomycetota bacterium]
GVFPWRLPAAGWWLVPVNWAVFNVFEFARKTHGADEEKPGIESYSGRLRPAGAALLSMSQVLAAAAGIFLVMRAADMPRAAPWTALGLSVPTAAASVLYALRPRRAAARVFRGVMTGFILASYLALAAAAAVVECGA